MNCTVPLPINLLILVEIGEFPKTVELLSIPNMCGCVALLGCTLQHYSVLINGQIHINQIFNV